MAYSYHDLHGMTIEQLREIAKGLDHEAVRGFTQMNKEHLLPALCKALGLEAHEQHAVVGIDKASVKAKLRTLKAERDKALAAHDATALRAVRRQMHHLKRRIRAATV